MDPILLLSLKKFLVLLACHLIGDYGLQNAWMVQNKGKDFHALVAHAATYTAPFIFLLVLPGFSLHVLVIPALFLIHVPVDYLKAKEDPLISLITDQLSHISPLIMTVAMGWI
jgi:hypothetical protein